MHQKTLLNIALALALAAAGSAFAQGNSRNHDRGNKNCAHGKCAGPDQRHRPSPNARQPKQPDYQRHDHRGAGPERAYYRGDRLPLQYRSRQYVVTDWRGHHLNAPPRGYQWVQSGSDYLLVAITTGIILQLFLSN